MKNQKFIEMIVEEINNNDKQSDNFVKKISEIIDRAQYDTKHKQWWVSKSKFYNEPKTEENLIKKEATEKCYNEISRLLESYYNSQHSDWYAPIVMHSFIPKNRN